LSGFVLSKELLSVKD